MSLPFRFRVFQSLVHVKFEGLFFSFLIKEFVLLYKI